MIYPGSSLRQSTIIANQPLVNTTEIVTPTSKLNRKVFHTPAIIQTIVDTPLDSHQIQHTQVHEPRILSYNQINPISVTASPFRTTVHNAVASTVRPYNEGGVKVHEDLSHLRTFDQETSHYVKEQRIRQKGLCSGFLNCIWGNNCSLWMCCLIPLLCLLLILGISYCVYQRNNNFNSSNFSTETRSVSISSNTQNIPQIINPIVSTDEYHPFVQSQHNTTIVQNNKSYPSLTNTNSFSNQQQYLKTTPSLGFSRTNNTTVTSNYQDTNNISQINNTSTIQNTINNQLQAPTIEQLQTKAMIQAQRYKRQMSNTTGLFHLRHSIQ